jgi:tRNA (guanosine-2'-O-)-methyltransferase
VIPQRYQRIKELLDRRQLDLTVLMENVHKSHNLSAIVRTCDAVGIDRVHAVYPDEREVPTYSVTAKGSQKWVDLKTHKALKGAINYLKQEKFNIYAAHLSDRALDYRTIDYTKPTAIVLGTEKWGISEEAADLVDGHIVIPMLGMVKSLNVSVAAAVILFEAQRQRLEAGMYEKPQLDRDEYQRIIFERGYPKVAAIYRKQGKPYPMLGEEGELL